MSQEEREFLRKSNISAKRLEKLTFDPNGTAKRLIDFGKQREERLALLRQEVTPIIDLTIQKIEKEGLLLKESPQINTEYRFKFSRKSVADVQGERDFDEKMDIYRYGVNQELDDLENCTFQPKINRHGRWMAQQQNRSVDDLIRWGESKKARQAEVMLRLEECDRRSFTPTLNRKSRFLTNGQNSIPAHERLFSKATQNQEKKDQLRAEESSKLFNPVLNPKSLAIVEKKDQCLFIKYPELRTDKLTYFQVRMAQKDSYDGQKTLSNFKKQSQVEGDPRYIPHSERCKHHTLNALYRVYPG